jgi:hypothetical protein
MGAAIQMGSTARAEKHDLGSCHAAAKLSGHGQALGDLLRSSQKDDHLLPHRSSPKPIKLLLDRLSNEYAISLQCF